MKSDALIGVASRKITPELGCQMSGFAARKGVAQGIHDDLYARALVIDDGATAAALVSLELLSIDRAFAGRVRLEIQKRTGIPASHIVLAATHTHCGPAIHNDFHNQGQPIDQAYLDCLANEIAGSVEDAHKARRSRRIRSGFVPVTGIAVNRRTADGKPVDPDAGVLVIEELDGKLAAIVVNYACHTTVLGPNTVQISGDFPFYTIDRLKRRFGSDVEVMFFNGAEGDISVGHKSDLSPVGVIAPFRTFEKAKELGTRLADAVGDQLDALSNEGAMLTVSSRILHLPLKHYASLSEMTARREEYADALRNMENGRNGDQDLSQELLLARQRTLFARIEEYYASLYERASEPEPKSLDAELICVKLGETALLSFPGEVFVAIGLAIREKSPVARTMFLGLANDYVGYIPTADANASAGYEVIAARVSPEAASILEQGALELLRSIQVTAAAS